MYLRWLPTWKLKMWPCANTEQIQANNSTAKYTWQWQYLSKFSEVFSSVFYHRRTVLYNKAYLTYMPKQQNEMQTWENFMWNKEFGPPETKRWAHAGLYTVCVWVKRLSCRTVVSNLGHVTWYGAAEMKKMHTLTYITSIYFILWYWQKLHFWKLPDCVHQMHLSWHIA